MVKTVITGSAGAPEGTQPSFLPDVEEVFLRFRSNLVLALRALNVDSTSGSAVAARFGLNRHLSWQLATIASESSAAAGLCVLPGTKGLGLFIQAASSRGLAPARAEELRTSLDALECAVRDHAGDRATLALLASVWSENAASPTAETLRRDGYRAQCALLGAQVDTQVRGVILGRSRTGSSDTVAMATYQAFDSLVRFRRDRPVRLFYEEAATHDDGTLAMSHEDFEEHINDKFRVIGDLSTASKEGVEVHMEGRRGWATLQPGPVGKTGASTWAFAGSPKYEAPRYHTQKDSTNQIGIFSYLPTKLLLLDFLLERSIAEETDLSAMSAMCFDASTGRPMNPVSRTDPAFLFEINEREPLSRATLAGDASYADAGSLASRAAATIGVSMDDLVGVRFRVRYVMSPICVVLTRNLAEKPMSPGTF